MLSLHDLLEYEPEDPNATPSFWQFINHDDIADKTDITGLLFQYFSEYPEKLIQLLNSNIIYPVPGFFSRRDNTSELYSMAIQIRLMLLDYQNPVTKVPSDFLLAYSIPPTLDPVWSGRAASRRQEPQINSLNLTAQEKEFVSRLVDKLELGEAFTLVDLFKALSKKLSETDFDDMTTARFLDIMENKPANAETELAAWEMHKLSNSVIQLKRAVFEIIKSTYTSSVLHQMLSMQQRQELEPEKERALTLFVNQHISSISALVRLFPDQVKTQLPSNPRDLVTLHAVSYSALKKSANKYASRQTQQQRLGTKSRIISFKWPAPFNSVNQQQRLGTGNYSAPL
ncbi:hypothetical protein [Endozoicomonas sp. 4G]|uniref:hypothetical protein n=1 Tax=Endozoicomonas sp. 4G TaxID=2872754 RepID=UPI0020789C72|nr:hypothetical protein [Endozoicomonas sp. 4G]